MGEPIVMYDKKGRSVTVYGKAQAAVMAKDEGWTFEPPTAAELHVSEEPVSEEEAAENVSVEKSAPVKKERTSARKGSKGKEL